MATNFQTVTLAGQRFVIVPEADFRRMIADTRQLPMPPRRAGQLSGRRSVAGLYRPVDLAWPP